MVSVQASVLSERRGDQPKQHNKQGEESRDDRRPRARPTHNSRPSDDARRGEDEEREEGGRAKGEERGAKGGRGKGHKARSRTTEGTPDTTATPTRRRTEPRATPRTDSDPRPNPQPPGRHKGQHAKAEAEGREEKRTKLVPTTTRHRRGFWCEPGRDTPSAGQYQSGVMVSKSVVRAESKNRWHQGRRGKKHSADGQKLARAGGGRTRKPLDPSADRQCSILHLSMRIR